MYKICFYVPPKHAETVKNAVFASGAGKVGEYSSCAWQVLGEGQFMPLEGSNAFIGTKNQLEKVPELKVEMVCEAKYIHAAIAALKQAHPYEEPAYQVFKLEDF
jgi:structural toxin protein (hemagglutinin/hemolysin) RtxA